MHQLILDIETQKTFDQVGGYFPEKLGISFVGAIERIGLPERGPVQETIYRFFEADLPSLWPLLQSADVIIGYNSDNFDLPALSAYYPGSVSHLPSLDLMARIKSSLGRRVSLDAIARHTLGTAKSGQGLDAIHYYQTHQFDKLAEYCLNDVKITRDLYDHGRQKGFIKLINKWNNLIDVDVDFSFTPNTTPGLQMSLI